MGGGCFCDCWIGWVGYGGLEVEMWCESWLEKRGRRLDKIGIGRAHDTLMVSDEFMNC